MTIQRESVAAASAGTHTSFNIFMCTQHLHGRNTNTCYTHSLLNLHIPYANSDLYFVSLSPQAEETSFHFDGSGYSVVQKSLRSTSTLIVLQFKTLSPVGLLLYLASNNTVRHTHLQSLLGFLFLRRHTHTSLSVTDRETSCPWSWWRGVFV